MDVADDGDVYLSARIGPGSYDRRYWSMDKLPTFGANNARDVVDAANAYERLVLLLFRPVLLLSIALFLMESTRGRTCTFSIPIASISILLKLTNLVGLTVLTKHSSPIGH